MYRKKQCIKGSVVSSGSGIHERPWNASSVNKGTLPQ